MSTVALIDCDYKTTGKTVFPNLCLMKISAYLKSQGRKTKLLTYDEYMEPDLFSEYDDAYAACVFTKKCGQGQEIGGYGSKGRRYRHTARAKRR